MIYNLFDIQFDQNYLIGYSGYSGYSGTFAFFDDTALRTPDYQHFDGAAGTYIYSTATVVFTMTLTQRFVLDISGEVDVRFIYQGVKGVSLLPLIPPKFRTSQMMLDYIDVVEVGVGSMLQNTTDLRKLASPYLVNESYIGLLAALLGVKFIGEDTATTEDLRRQLLDAVQWIKMKGTYDALRFIGFLTNTTVNLYDMYSDAGYSNIVDSLGNLVVTSAVGGSYYVISENATPYVTFVTENWFVAGYEEENPPDLGPTWFKTPHFVFEIQFKQYLTDDTGNYLWHDSMLSIIPEAIEQVRPINTVPHISGLLVAQTREDAQVETIPETLVHTIVSDQWVYNPWRFDQDTIPKFDEVPNLHLDNSRATFLSAIGFFQVGTGHKGDIPTWSGFALENWVYTGAISGYTETATSFIFDMTMPKLDPISGLPLVFTGLSELTLNFGDDTVVLACTFPDVDKTEGMELRFLITVTQV